jgi:hypothetical protein
MENSQIRAPARDCDKQNGVISVHIGRPTTSVKRGQILVKCGFLQAIRYILPQSPGAEAYSHERDEDHEALRRATAGL